MVEHKIVVDTPILAGISKKLFGYRVFAKCDFSDFRIIEWDKMPVTEEELKQYLKTKNNKDINSVLVEYLEYKRQKIEETWYNNGYVKIDYLFPRIHNDYHKIKTFNDYLAWIDWFTFFVTPIYYGILKNLGQQVKILDVKPEKVYLRIEAHYFSKTDAPVFYESLAKDSSFIVDLDAPIKEFTMWIGRSKKKGYGKITITK